MLQIKTVDYEVEYERQMSSIAENDLTPDDSVANNIEEFLMYNTPNRALRVLGCPRMEDSLTEEDYVVGANDMESGFTTPVKRLVTPACPRMEDELTEVEYKQNADLCSKRRRLVFD